MFLTIDELYPTGNTQAVLSTEEKRAVRFLASADFTLDRIAAEIRRSVEQVRAYAESVRLNIE